MHTIKTIDGEQIVSNQDLFMRDIMGACVVLEKHTKGVCTCSYCQDMEEEKRNIVIKLPECKARNAWRSIRWKKGNYYFYLRSTLPRWTRFLGFDFTSWGSGFRLHLLTPIWCRSNSMKSFLTICPNSPFKTKIPNVESLLWMSTVKCSCGDGETGCGSC